MKKNIFAVITVLAYTMNASALLIQPIRSNDVSDFELSLQIAAKSQKHKKAWAVFKSSQKKSALALKKAPALPLALEADAQKREIAAFERKLKEISQSQAATGSSSNTTSSVQENEQQNIPEAPVVAIDPPAPEVVVNTPVETAPVENIVASQEQLPEPPPVPEPPVAPEPPVIDVVSNIEPPPQSLPEPPSFEPPVVEPPVVVNEHANEHANNNAQNNSSTESNSQNNSSNASENSNGGGSDKSKGKK